LRDNLPPETKRAQTLAVDPTLLKVVSGPFKGLMADYLNLKAAVFMGGAWEVEEEDWEAVYTLMKQSLYLDPMFFQTGYYTQGLLAWRPTMHQKAIELLQHHAEHRHWDWEPMFYVGFNYSYYLGNNESAAHYMKLAAERPGAPPIVASLAARLAQKSGQTLTSIALLKTMYEQAKDEKTKAQYEKRLKAHLAVHEIEQAIDRFQKQHGRRPNELAELLSSGILDKLPENPFNLPFTYDADTGRVMWEQFH
jgi:tetratricopeptide (TPR) repeat protein